MAMMCKALFAARSPPRFRRCRTVFPDEAGTGLTPQSAAKLLRRGEAKVSGKLSPVDLAAMTTVAGVLLNLDEVINK